MSVAPAPRFRLTPTLVARCFFQDCERYLRYRAAGAEERDASGIPNPAFDHSPLMRAVLASGAEWEERVVSTHLKGRVKVAAGRGPLPERRFSPEQTLALLRAAPPGTYLYQTNLRPPEAFHAAYGLDPGLVRFGDNHPDLIEVRADAGRRVFRVVDVKRSEELRLTHRVQILLYALELEALLAEAGVADARADVETGAVWLEGRAEPEPFDLAEVRPHLERFLRHDLPRVLAAPAGDALWHFRYRCERCDYAGHCREEMRRTDDVSRLANLTVPGKRHLRDLGVRTLGDLANLLARGDADALLAGCASLAGERHYLEGRLAALATGKPRAYGTAAPLPKAEDVAVFVTLQREPLGRTTYLAGVLAHAKPPHAAALGDEVRAVLFGDGGKPRPWVAVAERPEETADVRRRLVRLLHAVLRDVHAYNDGRPWAEQLGLQVYAHTDRDAEQLTGLLMESLREPDLAEAAMTLLLHFQGPELINADEHAAEPVPFPVVVLQNALAKLLAVPVEVSYTLPETLSALGSGFRFARKDYFHYPLGHGLRSEAIHAAWHRGEAGMTDRLRREAGAYLFALRALLWQLRAQVGEHLFAWPPKFRLPAVADIEDPLLSRLAFFTRFESLTRCLELRAARQEPAAVQAGLGQALDLVAVTDDEFDVAGPPLLEVEPDGFPAWLLVWDAAEGRRAQLEFPDYRCRNRPWGAKASPHRAVVGVSDVARDELGFARRVQVTYAVKFQGDLPRPGERFRLLPRFTDYTSDPVIGHLAELDREGCPLLLDLLRDPHAAASRKPLPKGVEPHAAAGEAALGLTPSQLDAYRGIRSRRLQAVWGPPGTGKTHFLASVVLGLADAHARAGRPFRVLVTAFTHAAIENLLAKVAARRRELPAVAAGLALAKAKAWQGAGDPPGAVVADDGLAAWLDAHPHAAAGATAFSCLKARAKTGLGRFDLVIVDEASQVRVAEAAVAAGLVADGGRLVLAGDDLQLPPIVAASYPEPAEGEAGLHRSVFEAVRGRCPAGSPAVRMLTDNHRMNDVLTSFAAATLYGPDYRCAGAEVAARRIRLKPPRPLEPLSAACLDPDYPLVAVVLEGVRALAENRAEAGLVATLVADLRDGLLGGGGRRYRDDAEFFGRGVFVVSPHRAQNRAIRRELRRLRDWTSPPFVDTVDKMQGREADAVVVSYGVSDPEYALREAEFIYSVNRLNVAVTRARAKCVVCLPAPLLDAPAEVLEVPDAARGLAHMRGLVAALEARGRGAAFPLGEGVTARVLRAREPVGV